MDCATKNARTIWWYLNSKSIYRRFVTGHVPIRIGLISVLFNGDVENRKFWPKSSFPYTQCNVRRKNDEENNNSFTHGRVIFSRTAYYIWTSCTIRVAGVTHVKHFVFFSSPFSLFSLDRRTLFSPCADRRLLYENRHWNVRTDLVKRNEIANAYVRTTFSNCWSRTIRVVAAGKRAIVVLSRVYTIQ